MTALPRLPPRRAVHPRSNGDCTGSVEILPRNRIPSRPAAPFPRLDSLPALEEAGRLLTAQRACAHLDQLRTGIWNGMSGVGVRGWRARRDRQQRWGNRSEVGSRGNVARSLEWTDRGFDEGKQRDRARHRPAAQAVILVVYRIGMVVMVRVGAGLIGRMGEDPPVGIRRGTGVLRPRLALRMEVELVQRRGRDPCQIQQQEQRRCAARAARRAHFLESTTHSTEPASDPGLTSQSTDHNARLGSSHRISRKRMCRKPRKQHQSHPPRGDFFFLLLDARLAD